MYNKSTDLCENGSNPYVKFRFIFVFFSLISNRIKMFSFRWVNTIATCIHFLYMHLYFKSDGHVEAFRCEDQFNLRFPYGFHGERFLSMIISMNFCTLSNVCQSVDSNKVLSKTKQPLRKSLIT